ncbi:LOW QUALITY PROTEIN: filamin-A-interacting protein 1 [Gouania willdenowi]|uniref:LOW QUALITY PROTEIN: filamin-A-interacting protein 1 n=1 Tax=Gouania willdenowi TaxID=441366 RepID=UPI001054C7DD|nr:LOW QUALITY PROTEIN: filamin-A-interacting protein 1-like [Gouania willdenowi]
MRSRSCTKEGPGEENLHQKNLHQEEDFIRPKDGDAEPTQKETRVQKEKREVMKRPVKPLKAAENRKPAALDLSQTDLLHLLGIMEGEVQAREDIIGLLSSQRSGPDVLEAHYGSAQPSSALQALRRDALLTPNRTDDVYHKPMMELEHLEDKQKETYRRMREQLLLAEKGNRRHRPHELDNEKRKHVDFMNKSDDFTNLLEQERERLKRLLEQEKAYQARKEQDHSRQLLKVRAELVKLKSFALMLVDERQQHVEQIEQQSQKIQDLSQMLQEKEQRLTAVCTTAKDNAQKVIKLEAELEIKAAKITQDQEEMTAKMVDHESQSQQLRLKMSGLAQKIEELEECNKALQKSEENLLELREKISRGECGNSSLMAELENLRKKVLEMEGNDEEIIKTESCCRELKKKLQEKEIHGKELRVEVDNLQKRMSELEKLEEVFNKSKTECSQLHVNLEKEKQVIKDLSNELELMRSHLKELESSEDRFEKKEMVLKDDLMKLKSFTVILVDERKNMEDRLKQEEQKSRDLVEKFKEEQSKVTEVTEKLTEESKKLLKFKSEMEVQVTGLTEEKDNLKGKLASEEEACRELKSKMNKMKVRMNELEELEVQSKRANEEKNQKENQVKELSLEMEELRRRLKRLEVVEGDLMKTEDEYDLLEKKFRTEQDKANTLSKLLNDMKIQMAKNKALEKDEVISLENELRVRSRTEEVKTREMQVDIQALKEKIHELMNKEDELVQLQVDFSVLQQRSLEEEEIKKHMRKEMENLSRELEASRRYSRALRPSMNGRRMVDVPVTSTAVQTDSMNVEDETAAGFIRKSVLEEKYLMSNLRQQNQRTAPVLERYPPAASELGVKKSWIPWMKRNIEALSPNPGPLHIRVTPDSRKSTATLEITSPGAEDFFSSTTIIPTLGLQNPRITIVPKPTTVTSKITSCGAMGSSNRTQSPVTITAISRARSPESNGGRSNNHFKSPVSITVSSTPVAEACASPDPREVAASRTVIKMTPEMQQGSSPVQRYNSKGNIVTTEDNKIHIHLGMPFNRSPETQHGTVLRSPQQNSNQTSIKKSSITITPVSSMAPKVTQSLSAVEVPSTWSAISRLPLSKGVNPDSSAARGVSPVTRVESRSESQAMKINFRKMKMS